MCERVHALPRSAPVPRVRNGRGRSSESARMTEEWKQRETRETDKQCSLVTTSTGHAGQRAIAMQTNHLCQTQTSITRLVHHLIFPTSPPPVLSLPSNERQPGPFSLPSPLPPLPSASGSFPRDRPGSTPPSSLAQALTCFTRPSLAPPPSFPSACCSPPSLA